jgi:hypothetical protein
LLRHVLRNDPEQDFFGAKPAGRCDRRWTISTTPAGPMKSRMSINLNVSMCGRAGRE